MYARIYNNNIIPYSVYNFIVLYNTTLLHVNRDPISIRTTLKRAKEGHVDDFLALTDSIVGIIKCCPEGLAKSDSDSLQTLELDKRLKKVCQLDVLYNTQSACKVIITYTGQRNSQED